VFSLAGGAFVFVVQLHRFRLFCRFLRGLLILRLLFLLVLLRLPLRDSNRAMIAASPAIFFVPSIFDSLEVQVLYPAWSKGASR
jgi:hypothetical protein